MLWRWIVPSLTLLSTTSTDAFHDCVQAAAETRHRRRHYWLQHHQQQRQAQVQRLGSPIYSSKSLVQEESSSSSSSSSSCAGGICIGMKHGPHQGGNASYPVAWNGSTGTSVRSYMTVPDKPQQLDGITYYIWTDVFFGDGGLGRMNQFVPQLLLGSVLDASSGPPDYHPQWHTHDEWMFGAHYFYELFNPQKNRTDAHAAYGNLYPTQPGEVLYTTFELSSSPPSSENEEDEGTTTDTTANRSKSKRQNMNSSRPRWTLTMGVLGDDDRISTLVVDQPYMGTQTHLTDSWLEAPYHNMCINACWELYGAKDASHLPSSGARYNLFITQPNRSGGGDGRMSRSGIVNNSTIQHNDDATTRQPRSGGDNLMYPFTRWEQDEGNGVCPSCTVRERHDNHTQEVLIDISVSPPSPPHDQKIK